MPEVDVKVTNNADGRRWEARIEGELAGFLRYGRLHGRTTLVHTEVDPAFGGRGVGSALARAALAAARQGEDVVVVRCPFVASWVRRHPEFASFAELVPDRERDGD